MYMNETVQLLEKNIMLPAAELAAFCQRWQITEFALFGSVLRGDFRSDSDVDVLVTFAPSARWSLFDLVTMQDELTGIFGRSVDLLTRNGVAASRNYIRRNAILSSAQVVYAAG